MHVCLDYTPALRQGAGVARYARELTRHLLLAARPGDRYTLLYTGRREPPGAFPRGAGGQRIARDDRLWRLLLLLTHASFAPPADRVAPGAQLYHGTNWAAPRFRRLPTVITVHDTTFLTHPDCHTPASRLYLALAARASVRRATRIIAVSQATAVDTVRYLGADPDRVRVVHEGVDPRFRPQPEAEAHAHVADRLGLRRPYVLFLGTLEPRKDVDVLVRAFERLAPDHPDLELVLAGAKGWRADALLRRIEASPVRGRIRRLGHVPDEHLPALYTAAAVFAYPSRYEGFGLPPLEALACGTPVVAADAASLPEVVGAAGSLVRPGDSEALAAALDRLLQPGARAALAPHAKEQASRFTWTRAADATRAVYREAAEQAAR